MHTPTPTTLCFALAVGSIMSMNGFVVADGPETITLTGIVRDFHECHSDFERRPDHGFGLYAGNVDVMLGADRKPVFTGNGYRVTTRAEDAEGRRIAPHLAGHRAVAMAAPADDTADSDDAMLESAPASSTVLNDYKDIRSYDVKFMGTDYNADGTSTWRYKVVRLPGARRLKHFMVTLSDEFDVVGGNEKMKRGKRNGHTGVYWTLNNSFREGVFEVTLGKHYEADVDGSKRVAARSGSKVKLGDLTAPAPTFSGMDEAPDPVVFEGPFVPDDRYADDKLVVKGAADTASTASEDSFNQWYNNMPGVNQSMPLPITLVRQEDGTYVFDDRYDDHYAEVGGFFPIDGKLFGNSGGNGPDHNYHFTFELHTTFTYDADGSQVFSFSGDDDVWVFINDMLVIDLAGIHGREEQSVDLNRLGLVDGQEYTLDFFFAERHRTQSNFRMTTNLSLESDRDLPAITAMFD